MSIDLDPVKYEVFVRRLNSVLEEGRQAVAMVSGSPAIVEGGEFMTSVYESNGGGILAAAGTLFHVMGSADSIRHAIKEYEENPGIHEGDQLFYNDPYIAGTHLMDQIVIKPIFYKGARVGWVGTMTHTGDVGGILRGASKEIFHEGVKIRGLKIVEGGKVRKDTLQAITEQCRDPEFVSQDILARVASNNVCDEGYLRLVEKFGIDFVKKACKKLTQDAEKMFRNRLKGLPDGTWRERVHITRTKRVGGKEEPLPLHAICTLRKEGDQLYFDIDASPQTEDYCNAALPASRSCLFSALAACLLWDIPWNSDVMEWVHYKIPEGTFLNCRYPASCGLGPMVGLTLLAATAGALAKMLYAAGLHDLVNASWAVYGGGVTNSGPGVWYGGHDQYGRIVGQGTYDLFEGGQGATPNRDGNNTGGLYVNPRSAGADVEWTESYYPLLYFAQKQGLDSGGFGKFRGGMNLESLLMVYGTKDLTVDYLPVPEGGAVRGFGLFGGFAMGGNLGESVLALTSKEELLRKFSEGSYPTSNDQLGTEWGVNARRSAESHMERQLGGIRIEVPEYSLIGYSFGCGGGYGDPLDRDPVKVMEDAKNEAITLDSAKKVYGVILDPKTFELDTKKSEEQRQKIIKERLSKGKLVTTDKPRGKLQQGDKKKSLIRISEYLEVVEKRNATKVICCVKCQNEFCSSDENYKKYSLRRTRDLSEVKEVTEGEQPVHYYQEYICPGCGTLLQVDPWCPAIESDEPLWDIAVKV